MALNFTQPITSDIYPEGSVGGRALGATHKLSARGKTQSGSTGADIDFSNLVNDLDKLKADLYKTIHGLTFSNNGTDADHDIDIAPGACADSTNAVVFILESAITKRIDANWAEGTNQGGFPSGLSLSVSTWYHVFLILKIDVEAGTYTVDAGFDTSTSATNLLSDATNYTHYRRIGSVLTDGSSNILAFDMNLLAGGGIKVVWDALPTLNKNAAVSTGSRESITLTVPPDYKVEAIMNAIVTGGGGGTVYFSDLAQSDQAASTTAAPVGQLAWTSGSTFDGSQIVITTNTSKQVGARGSSAGTLRVASHGWIDQRAA